MQHMKILSDHHSTKNLNLQSHGRLEPLKIVQTPEKSIVVSIYNPQVKSYMSTPQNEDLVSTEARNSSRHCESPEIRTARFAKKTEDINIQSFDNVRSSFPSISQCSLELNSQSIEVQKRYLRKEQVYESRNKKKKFRVKPLGNLHRKSALGTIKIYSGSGSPMGNSTNSSRE